MIKKLSIFLLMTFLLFSSVNAVEYLNSCGKSSGWTNGETYILNFTEIPSGYANNYCFQYNSNLANNITIKGYNQTIISKYPNTFRFFLSTDNVDFEATVKDFTIKNTENNLFWFFDVNGANDNNGAFVSGTFENLKIFDVTNFGLFENSGSDVFGRRNELYNSTFQEFYYIGDYFFQANSNSNNYPRFSTNNFENSYIVADNLFFDYQSTSQYNNNYFDNVALVSDDSLINTVTSNIYNNSILTKYPVNDTNDDGNGDSQAISNAPNPKVWIDTNEFNFFQDVAEGRGDNSFNFVTDKTKNYIFLSSNEIFELPELLFFDDNNEVSFPISNNLTNSGTFESFSIWELQNTNLNCSILNINPFCFFNNELSVTTRVEDYRGHITLMSNIFIKDTNMTQNANASLSNLHIFATEEVSGTPTQESNINLLDNIFNKEDASSGTGEEFFAIFATNFEMKNNSVNMDTIGDPANVYHFMNLRSTTASSNKIHNNTFLNSGSVNPAFPFKIFSINCDTKFYNNYIGANVTVLDYNCGTELNLSPLVPYEHSNGNVYYFHIGNYYEENVACTDADVDGICDSPYNGTEYTDDRPLSSYPFDFDAQIGNAELVVSNTSFIITLTEPTDNETITVSGATSSIDFGFFHDSDFPDLRCDYVLDGAVVDSENPAVKNTNYSTSLTGWTEKSYTYRVECYNDMYFEQSNEITFTVQFGTPTGNGGDDGGMNFSNPGLGIFNPANLFNGDTNDATEEIFGIMSFISFLYGHLLYLGFFILFIAIIILIVTLPRLLNRV